VVIPLINKLVQPNSVLDVGCGVGTWLAEWERQGVTDIVGLDGDYVDRTALQIDPGKFTPTDLAKNFSLRRTFDLVECLEVAEHLHESCADKFIECLTTHGDIVLFSAAIPGQGGTHHVNEQWPSYWAERFFRAGFRLYDVIRPLIWTDSSVEWWYRQNVLIFSKSRAFGTTDTPLDLVHPEVWLERTRQPPSAHVLRAIMPRWIRQPRKAWQEMVRTSKNRISHNF
jgi:SAM-dependent methyltransferase